MYFLSVYAVCYVYVLLSYVHLPLGLGLHIKHVETQYCAAVHSLFMVEMTIKFTLNLTLTK